MSESNHDTDQKNTDVAVYHQVEALVAIGIECRDRLEALQRVNQELGTATAVITHNAGIAQMADRVIHLADGQISEVNTNETKLAPRELSW